MTVNYISGRTFLAHSRTAAAALATSAALMRASKGGVRGDRQSRVMRLGGPIFVKSSDPAVLAQAHRELGYRAAYAPDVKLTDRDLIQATIKEFGARDV